MDKQLFHRVCDEVVGRDQGLMGIGTLGEKTVHSVLKYYYEPNKNNHEIRIKGYVADICNGYEIVEVQSRDFNKLKKKLEVFLDCCPVTIVYPVPYIKLLRWVDPQTGEISKPRKSSRKGTPYMIFPELYKIKNYLLHPNLRIKIVLLNIEEYRLLDGWSSDRKKGSSKCDRIPVNIIDELYIANPRDYDLLIPDTLKTGFTSKDYKKATGLPTGASVTALHVLNYVGAVKRTGKKGHAFLYSR